MQTTPLGPESLVSFVSTTQAGMLWQAAGCTVVFYDHITTFDKEVELIWSQKWTFVSGLYLLNRYLGDALFLHGSSRLWASGKNLEKICPSVFQVQSWLGMLTVFAMNGIIIKRVVCMYGNSKKVLWTLLTALFILAIYSSVLTGLLSKAPSVVVRIPFTYTFETCVPSEMADKWYWSFLFFTLAFDSLILGMSLYKGIALVRERAKVKHQPEALTAVERIWQRRGDFIGVLVRDSILFPLICLVIQLFSILAWAGVLPADAFQIAVVLAAASGPTLGCRLILNLREAYYKPFQFEYDRSQTPISLVSPSFADSPAGRPSLTRASIQLQALRRPSTTQTLGHPKPIDDA